LFLIIDKIQIISIL